MFDYDRALLVNDHLRSLESGVTTLEQARQKSGLTIGYPGWNLLYYSTLCGLDRERDNIIVETGSNLGCSTIVLAQALKDSGLPGHVHSVELSEANARQARANVARAGLEALVTLACGDSVTFLRALAAGVPLVRLAFLDGSHEQDTVVAEFEAIHPLLDDRSLVFFDNTYRIAEPHEDQRVNGALRIITRRFGGNLVNFENTSWFTPGQAIWQRRAFSQDWDQPRSTGEARTGLEQVRARAVVSAGAL
jgi:hypothetical protein